MNLNESNDGKNYFSRNENEALNKIKVNETVAIDADTCSSCSTTAQSDSIKPFNADAIINNSAIASTTGESLSTLTSDTTLNTTNSSTSLNTDNSFYAFNSTSSSKTLSTLNESVSVSVVDVISDVPAIKIKRKNQFLNNQKYNKPSFLIEFKQKSKNSKSSDNKCCFQLFLLAYNLILFFEKIKFSLFVIFLIALITIAIYLLIIAISSVNKCKINESIPIYQIILSLSIVLRLFLYLTCPFSYKKYFNLVEYYLFKGNIFKCITRITSKQQKKLISHKKRTIFEWIRFIFCCNCCLSRNNDDSENDKDDVVKVNRKKSNSFLMHTCLSCLKVPFNNNSKKLNANNINSLKHNHRQKHHSNYHRHTKHAQQNNNNINLKMKKTIANNKQRIKHPSRYKNFHHYHHHHRHYQRNHHRHQQQRKYNFVDFNSIRYCVTHFIQRIIDLFILCWFVYGNYLIFSVNQDNLSNNNANFTWISQLATTTNVNKTLIINTQQNDNYSSNYLVNKYNNKDIELNKTIDNNATLTVKINNNNYNTYFKYNCYKISFYQIVITYIFLAILLVNFVIFSLLRLIYQHFKLKFKHHTNCKGGYI